MAAREIVLLSTRDSSLVSLKLDSRVPLTPLRAALPDLPYRVKPPIVIFGRTVSQPRDVCFLSNDSAGYAYSNQFMAATRFSAETECFAELLRLVNTAFAASFNGILVNRYVDGRDYIGAHSDDETGMDVAAGVVSISFGATRTFRVRTKQQALTHIAARVTHVNENAVTRKSPRCFDIPLHDAQIVVMRGAFQREFTHEIPKELRVKGTRYNLTFRRHVQ